VIKKNSKGKFLFFPRW